MAGLTPKFNPSDIVNMIEDRKEKIRQAVIARFQFIGETFVTNARSTKTYKDHTGNLRNSIGYIILENGEQIFDNFEKSAQVEVLITKGKSKGKTILSSGADEGLATGHDFAGLVASRFPRGLVLIVVAGMEYAAAVESRGYDVLTGSGTEASTDLKLALEELTQKIGRMK
jgi:3-dehydroquinate synthetase